MGEKSKLTKLSSKFSAEMLFKLVKKMRAGYSGWQDTSFVSNRSLRVKLLQNVDRKDWVDVGALAAILWWRSKKKGE